MDGKSAEKPPESKPETSVVNPKPVEAPGLVASTVNEALERAQQSNEDRVVEAAGKKGGLRGALAARLEAMRDATERFRTQGEEGWQKSVVASKSAVRRPWLEASRNIYMRTWSPLFKGVEKTAAFLRDRLQPKPATRAPAAK